MAQRLAQDHHVRPHAFMVAGEQLAGAAQAGLNFIGHEQDVVAAAQVGHGPQVPGGRHDDAGLALDGLQQHGGGVGRNRVLQGRRVAIGDGDEAGREGAERVAVGGLGGERNDAQGAAVEVPRGGDDLRLAGREALDGVAPLAGQLQGGLHCLGAGVHRQREVVAGERVQGFIEQPELVVAEGARGQRELLRLLHQGRHNSRVAVALVQRRIG